MIASPGRLSAAVQERIIVKNPTDGTVIPKANYAPKNILTEAQLQKFLDVVRQDDVWSDFFYTELTTGMRRGEICGLRWQDFDDKTGRLQIRRAVTSRKGGGVKVGETKTEKGTLADFASTQYRGDPKSTEKEILQRMDLP